MGGVYERLVGVLEEEDEPRVAVRRILETLRDASSVTAEVGIEPARWQAAVDTLLVAVDAADAAEAEQRRRSWATMRRQFEALGCRVSRPGDDDNRWMIEGVAVEVEVDLSTGEISGLDYGPNVRFENLVRDVRRMIESKRTSLAEQARRTERRKTHSWDNKVKGWVPKSGEGPVIRGGA